MFIERDYDRPPEFIVDPYDKKYDGPGIIIHCIDNAEDEEDLYFMQEKIEKNDYSLILSKTTTDPKDGKYNFKIREKYRAIKAESRSVNLIEINRYCSNETLKQIIRILIEDCLIEFHIKDVGFVIRSYESIITELTKKCIEYLNTIK